MIEVKNIFISKGNKVILDSVNMNANKGEILAVAGANGSGKSTLLKTISGFEKPTSGEIFLNGKNIQKYTQKDLAKSRAFLSQETHIPYSISVLEVVAMGRFPYLEQERKNRSYEIAHQILSDLGMQHFGARDIRTLSGGERQKIHFARVLAQIISNNTKSSKFLLLDEPLKGLDLTQQYFLLNKIQECVHQNNLGVIMVLHDLNLISQYADRVILLADKNILAKGNPKEVINSENINEAFGISVIIAEHPIYQYPIITPIHQPYSKKIAV